MLRTGWPQETLFTHPMPVVDALRWAIYVDAIKPGPEGIRPDSSMPEGLTPPQRIAFAQGRQNAAEVAIALYPADEPAEPLDG